MMDANRPLLEISRIARKYVHLFESNFELEALVAQAHANTLKPELSGISSASHMHLFAQSLPKSLNTRTKTYPSVSKC
jgi:hypothetical protein